MIFQEENKIDNYICHSGGAIGADTFFEELCERYGIEIRAYSYKTGYHKSKNKVEISEEVFQEGVSVVSKINNKYLKRRGINKYMHLLARNFAQIKNTEVVYAISELDNGLVKGGTAYACYMAIDARIPVYLFEQKEGRWYRYSFGSEKFVVENDPPIIKYGNFTGIGTRKLNSLGEKAIEELFSRSF